MPREDINSDHNTEVNWRPWSVVISWGTPNLDTQERRRAVAQSVAVAEASGTASNHPEYLSMMVRMYVIPSDSGNGPTRSR